MMKTVARSFHWASPAVLNQMYCDNQDSEGIEYWYDDVVDQHKEIEKRRNKKK